MPFRDKRKLVNEDGMPRLILRYSDILLFSICFVTATLNCTDLNILEVFCFLINFVHFLLLLLLYFASQYFVTIM